MSTYPLLIESSFAAPLSQNIQKEYNNLMQQVTKLSPETRARKKINGTGGLVSVNDLIAYQIGWTQRVIAWYEAGLKQEIVEMPGDGFTQWHYTEIARHFYKKYGHKKANEQDLLFYQSTKRIIEIVEKTYEEGTLDKPGVWDWTTLQSGKKWPLSKWIQINTVAPFKKATTLIRRFVRQ